MEECQRNIHEATGSKRSETVMLPTGPEDLLNEVEGWQRKTSAGRHTKVAEGIRASIAPFKRLSDSINMMA